MTFIDILRVVFITSLCWYSVLLTIAYNFQSKKLAATEKEFRKLEVIANMKNFLGGGHRDNKQEKDIS